MRAARPAVAGAALAATLLAHPAIALEPAHLVRTAIELACPAQTRADIDRMVQRFPDGAALLAPAQNINLLGWRARIALDGYGTVTVERIAPNGNLRRVSVQYESTPDARPVLLAMANFRCEIYLARRLHYDAGGKAQWIEHLDDVLDIRGELEPLNPPVPVHANPRGVPVALVDTGVNYLLPAIYERLARDANGDILGYDFWDRDRRPYDAHPVASPFFPRRHGTQTATLLLQAAPVAKLVPYRYPRPHMDRMAELVAHAAANGIRLVNISLSSFDRREWQPLYQAMRANPQMLFVAAAGNKGWNLDRKPAFPAAFALENLIAVTAAKRDGALAPGVNFGARTVALMAPADQVAVTGFDGGRHRVSGSSYAAVRVTALAACLLGANPGLTVPELKSAIFDLAAPPSSPGFVSEGFLPESSLRGRGVCPIRRPRSGI